MVGKTGMDTHLKRRWVVIGSVLGLFVLSLASGMWRFERHLRPPITLAWTVARNSPKIRDIIGEPRYPTLARGNLVSKGGDGNADLTIRLYGSRGRGTLMEWAQEDKGKWHICSLQFQPRDGSASISLVADTSTHCERE